MLSDREQQALQEVESRLTADDPGFARAIRRRQQDMSGRHSDRRADRIVFATTGALGFVGLCAGAGGNAIVLVLLALFAWEMWRSTGFDEQRGTRE